MGGSRDDVTMQPRVDHLALNTLIVQFLFQLPNIPNCPVPVLVGPEQPERCLDSALVGGFRYRSTLIMASVASTSVMHIHDVVAQLIKGVPQETGYEETEFRLRLHMPADMGQA